MPIKCPSGKKPRHRVRTFPSGKKVKLVFCDNEVVEATKLENKVKKKLNRRFK